MIRHQSVLQQVHDSCTQSYTHFAWRRVNNLVINGDNIRCWSIKRFLELYRHFCLAQRKVITQLLTMRTACIHESRCMLDRNRFYLSDNQLSFSFVFSAWWRAKYVIVVGGQSSCGFAADPVISSALGAIPSSPYAGHVSAGYQISFVRTDFTWYLGGAGGIALGLDAEITTPMTLVICHLMQSLDIAVVLDNVEHRNMPYVTSTS